MLTFPHRISGESDGWRLPGDAEAGAVGGSETGGGRIAAAGGDGHWSCGLKDQIQIAKRILSYVCLLNFSL